MNADEFRPGVLLPYLKAVVGFVAPGAVLLAAAVTGPSPGGTSVTAGEWVTAGCACVVTAAGVWATPNADKPKRPGRRRRRR